MRLLTLKVLLGILLLGPSYNAEADCKDAFDRQTLLEFIRCAKEDSNGASVAKVAYAHSQIGWLALLAATASDSLYRRGFVGRHEELQTHNPGTEVGSFYLGLAELMGGNVDRAEEILQGYVEGQNAEPRLAERARDVLTLLTPGAREQTQTTPTQEAISQTLGYLLRDEWPQTWDAGPDSSPTERLLGALARRDEQAVEEILLDANLTGQDYTLRLSIEDLDSGQSEAIEVRYFDPLAAKLVARAHFFIAGRRFLSAALLASSERYFNEAAFNANLAKDSETLAELSTTPCSRLYLRSYPDDESNRQSVNGERPPSDTSDLLALARVWGIMLKNHYDFADIYNQIIADARHPIEKSTRLQELACAHWTKGNFRAAEAAFQAARITNDLSPLAEFGGLVSSVITSGFTEQSTAFLVQELPDLEHEYPFLATLSENAKWYSIWLKGFVNEKRVLPSAPGG